MNTLVHNSKISTFLGSLMLIAALTFSANASADCASQERDLMDRLQASLNDSDPDSICQTARRMIPLLRQGISYYRNCPVADPSGQMLTNLEGNLEVMLDTERQVCAR